MGTTLPRSWRRFRRDTRAITPVIGTVLVLFIIILAMGSILLWGVPAIRGLQEHAEFESVLTQMIQLNADIRNLRDPENTRLVTVSMSQGSLKVVEGSRWVLSAATHADYSYINVTGWETGTGTTITLTSAAPNPAIPATARITLDWMQGGQPTNEVTCASSCGNPAVLTLPAVPTQFTIDNKVIRIQITDGGVLKNEIWVFETGRLTYVLNDRSDRNRVHIEMGGVFVQQGPALFLEEAPSVKDPVWDSVPKDTSFFVRLLELDGSTTAGGKGRHPVFVNLVDNYGVLRGRPRIDPAVSLRFQVDDGGAVGTKGILEEAFCNYLEGRDSTSFFQQGNAGDCAGGDVNVLYDPPNDATHNAGEFVYELNHGVVKTIVEDV